MVSARFFVALVLIILASLLSACGSTGPAPVVSREYPAQGASPKRSYGGYYRVKSGDSLYAIAWRVGRDFRSLAAWNGIRPPYTIYPGQRLRLGPSPNGKAESKRKQKPAPKKEARKKAHTTGVKTAPVYARKKAAGVVKKTKTASKKKRASASRLRWQWPTQGRVLQRFSNSDRTRQGIKIVGRFGQPIRAAEAGTIVYSGSGLIGYGRLIIVKHNKNFLSAYGHNRKILVKEGDQVAKGERIAEMGKSSDGKPVLHFEIRRQGTPVDPVALLPNRS
jgi:lipoprotein NlpD